MPQRFNSWIEAAAALTARGEAFVVVTVLQVKGSAPRDSGTKILITECSCIDSIGGGHLEYLAIDKAKRLLMKQHESAGHTPLGSPSEQCIESYPLGPVLGQCCGGQVTLMYEVFAKAATTIAVFGAGHVGRALIQILQALPVNVHWVDSRADEFPETIPTGIKQVIPAHPVEHLAELPAHAHVVIMTHNHATDFELVQAALQRGDCRYIGVIGSHTKALRFRKRLQKAGYPQFQINTVRCPIGLAAVPGKHPMEIAVSIAGELIADYQSPPMSEKTRTPPALVKLPEQTDLDAETKTLIDNLWTPK